MIGSFFVLEAYIALRVGVFLFLGRKVRWPLIAGAIVLIPLRFGIFTFAKPLFAGRGRGTVTVRLERRKGGLRLEVAADGEGMRPGGRRGRHPLRRPRPVGAHRMIHTKEKRAYFKPTEH